MGFLTVLKAFVRRMRDGARVSEAQIDLGGGDIRTGIHVSSPGEDSYPLDSDQAVAVPYVKTGQFLIVGYLDTVTEPTAEPGEKRLFSRDSQGAIAAEVTLANDGTVTLSNSNGSIVLQSGGNVILNGVSIDSSGNISTPGSISADVEVSAATIDLTTHVHSGVTTGVTNSGPPAP